MYHWCDNFEKLMTKFKRRCGMVFSLFFCVLLCGCQVLFPEEHTELIVDGKYRPFNVPRMTMEKLMELVEAEDVDYIYEVFSPAVRENTEGLYEQIQEFIRFVEENVTAWDFSSGSGTIDRKSGVTLAKQTNLYTFETSSGIYRCDISDVVNNTTQEDTIGFSNIMIFPEELSKEYAPKKPAGVYIVYRVEDIPPNASAEPFSLEILMQFTAEGNSDDVYELFSLNAKKNAKELKGKTLELMDFLNEQVISWEPYTWTKNIEIVNGAKVTTQEMFFYLHTNSEMYRCDIREVLENRSKETDTGFSSISIFPALYPGEKPEYEDEVYKGYCTWGRENMGISIVYQ